MNFQQISIPSYFSTQKNNTLHYIIDEKQKEFLKECINPENKISGARIKLLPNGTLLARAGFSLFAKNLKFNNDSNYDWDEVIFIDIKYN